MDHDFEQQPCRLDENVSAPGGSASLRHRSRAVLLGQSSSPIDSR
jgi:hypothetical protein